jgi:molybdate transport system substrate-binding protein
MMLSLAGCLAPAHAADRPARVPAVTIFAAASLADAFTELARRLEAQHPGWRFTTSFAGSQQLAAHIEHGASADVFAAADRRWMEYLEQRGLLAGAAHDFARNRLVVIVPRANPGRVRTLEDLARPGLKLVIGADTVPVGRYSREALAKLASAPGFGADFAERVLRNVVSEEENVQGVVAKVQLGEADAGFVYRSDVAAPVQSAVAGLEIPDAYNVVATYPIAILKDAPHAAGAQLVVDFLLSRQGQQLLRTHHFLPVEAQ